MTHADTESGTEPDMSTPTPGTEEPAAPWSVRAAGSVLAVQAALLAALVVATVVWEDTLVRAWAEDNPAARDLVVGGGLAALRESSIAIPAFVPIVVVVFLTMVPLGGVLAAMFHHRAPWTVPWLTVLAATGGLACWLFVRTAPPLAFSSLAVLGGLSCVLLIGCLWHPDTRRWLSARPQPRREVREDPEPRT